MSTGERSDREPAGDVNPSDFELHVSMPNDVRLAGAVRALAVCAAQQAGCPDAAAAAFGRDVEDAVRASLTGGPDDPLPVTVRQRERAIEVVVNGHTLVLDA